MIDPVGLLSDRDTIVGHVMQVVHLNPIFDLQLIQMFDDGLEDFERQVEAMLAGTHPRHRTIAAIVEEPDYHARLLDYVRRFRADPDTAPLVRAEQTLRSDPVLRGGRAHLRDASGLHRLLLASCRRARRRSRSACCGCASFRSSSPPGARAETTCERAGRCCWLALALGCHDAAREPARLPGPRPAQPWCASRSLDAASAIRACSRRSPAFRATSWCRRTLREYAYDGPAASDRPRPDDLAALRGGLHDGAARAARRRARARDRHRLGLPGGRARAARARGLLDRDREGARRAGARRPRAARLCERARARRRRLPGLARAGAFRRHHRDGGSGPRAAAARSTSSRWAAAWCCRWAASTRSCCASIATRPACAASI